MPPKLPPFGRPKRSDVIFWTVGILAVLLIKAWPWPVTILLQPAISYPNGPLIAYTPGCTPPESVRGLCIPTIHPGDPLTYSVYRCYTDPLAGENRRYEVIVTRFLHDATSKRIVQQLVTNYSDQAAGCELLPTQTVVYNLPNSLPDGLYYVDGWAYPQDSLNPDPTYWSTSVFCVVKGPAACPNQ